MSGYSEESVVPNRRIKSRKCRIWMERSEPRGPKRPWKKDVLSRAEERVLREKKS